MALLPLRNRKGMVVAFALVDDADSDDLGQWRWCRNGNGYVWRRAVTEDGRQRNVYLHRYLMDCHPGDGKFVDHINRDRLDNRRDNLRILTPVLSAQNRPSLGGTSEYRGVAWDRSRGRWMAYAQLNNRMHNLGRFEREEDAAEAAAAWRRMHMPAAVE